MEVTINESELKEFILKTIRENLLISTYYLCESENDQEIELSLLDNPRGFSSANIYFNGE